MPVRPVGPAGIPNIGLGTWETAPDQVERIVAAALDIGYTHVDTAQAYENEEGVGRGLRSGGPSRDEIFLTTKIFPGSFRAKDFREAAETSLRRLQVDYLDLLLLHWPSKDEPLAETLETLDKLVEEGKVRHAGVSNFTIAHLRETLDTLQAPLAANQVEFHPFIDQTNLMSFMAEHQISLEAYSPLARGQAIGNATLAEIARDHDASEAQIATAWVISKPDAVALPKTSTESRLAENLASAEIELTAEEIERIDQLGKSDGRIVDPGFAPDWDD